MRPTNVRYGVLATLCVAAALAYIARTSLAVPADIVSADLGLSEEQMSWALGVFFLFYAIFQIPAGRLGQALGSRRALALYALLWSVGTAFLGLANGLAALITLRLLMGVAQAGLFPCAVSSISHWLPVSRRALACGALGAFMGIGGALGNYLSGVLLGALTWRQTFAALAAPGVVFAVCFWIWFRDRPSEHRAVNAAELALIAAPGGEAGATATGDRDARREPVPWVRLFTSPAMALISGQQFFRAAGAVFYVTWFPTYLQKSHGVDVLETAWLSSAPLIAQVVGSLGGGVFVDIIFHRTGSLRLSRQGVALVSLSAYATCFLAAGFLATTALAAVALITLGHLIGTLTGPCAYAITIDRGGRHVETVFATMNTAGNLGAAVCPWAVARFVGWTGSWDLVPLFFAGLYAASATCWALLGPSRSVFDRD